MNTRLLDALHGRNHSGRPPVWLMRQAGRSLPEYRRIRQNHSFLTMCHTPEIASEITLLPIKRLAVDAAVLFSDILVVPEALGMGVRFEEGIGPIIERPIRSVEEIAELPDPDIEESLSYVAETIALLLPQLSVPLIGFAGAPFTLASYMIEGKIKGTKKFLLHHPEAFHTLLDHLADCTIRYLNMQIKAGVHAVQLFDTWAGALGHSHFREFSLHYLKKILEGLDDSSIPVILFCRGSSVFAHDLASIGPNAISLDWNIQLSELRKTIPSSVAFQGNLDPDILYAPLPVVKRETQKLIEEMKGDPAYICNLGHGIHPDTPVEAVQTFVDTVKE